MNHEELIEQLEGALSRHLKERKLPERFLSGALRTRMARRLREMIEMFIHYQTKRQASDELLEDLAKRLNLKLTERSKGRPKDKATFWLSRQLFLIFQNVYFEAERLARKQGGKVKRLPEMPGEFGSLPVTTREGKQKSAGPFAGFLLSVFEGLGINLDRDHIRKDYIRPAWRNRPIRGG